MLCSRAMATHDNDRFETLAIHAGQHPDPTTGAVMTPVYFTSTYAQSGPGEHKGFEYSRTRNPTRDALQGCLAALEGGKHALAFASGLAATDAVLHLLSAGDHMVLSDDLYGGTFRLADKVFKRLGIEQSYVDVTDLRAVEAALRPQHQADVGGDAHQSDVEDLRSRGARRGLPEARGDLGLRQHLRHALLPAAAGARHRRGGALDDQVPERPQRRGGGRAGPRGATTCRRSSRSCRMRWARFPGRMDSFLVLRGLKTLHVRMERHEENARTVAEALRRHPKVLRVTWPGLAGPSPARARAQADEGIRRHAHLRDQGRAAGRAHVPQIAAAVRGCRVPRGRGEPDRASRRS